VDERRQRGSLERRRDHPPERVHQRPRRGPRAELHPGRHPRPRPLEVRDHRLTTRRVWSKMLIGRRPPPAADRRERGARGDGTMEYGAHLPLMDFGGHPYTLDHLTAYARRAADLGFATLAANALLVFAVPWFDGPTALAAVAGASGSMTLATTVALPVVRGPVPLAKTMAALDRLSGGRVVVGVGPGSSPLDHEAVGLDFDER